MSGPADDALARRRFAVITGVRLGGIGAFLVGIAILAGALATPAAAGYGLVVAGAVCAFLAPTLLARRWSTRRLESHDRDHRGRR